MPYTCTKISWEIPVDLVHVSVGPTCHFSQVGEPIITQESLSVLRSTHSGGRTAKHWMVTFVLRILLFFRFKSFIEGCFRV